ncbi:hypothetical protein AB0M89_36785 [Streptomyces microflavus]|uniref:hypothetical protein n=1 Tax=Streptomyces microflavus TaxID=1919 RepID=UPI0034376D2B
MTTLPLERLIDVPAVSAPGQHCLVDPYDEPYAVIGLRVVVSRDHVAAAVDMGVHKYYGDGRSADSLTVDEIRYHTAALVLSEDALGLQRAGEAMAQLAVEDFHEEVTREHIRACYRAADRAYPKL